MIAELELDGDAARAADLLDGWDGRADVDSAQAAYFAVFWRHLLDDMFGALPEQTRPRAGTGGSASCRHSLGDPDARWWTNEDAGVAGRDAMLAHALDEGVGEASDRMGCDPDGWRWGRLHTLTLTNQSFGESGIGPIEWLFNRGPYELGGGSSVVNAIGWDATIGYGVDWVPSMRMIVDLADFDASTWINLTGASGHAFHPHYATRPRSGSAARRGRGRSRWPPCARRPPTRCSWTPPADARAPGSGRGRPAPRQRRFARLRPRGTCAWARRCRAAAGGRSSSAGRGSSRASAPSSRAGGRSRTAR